MKNTLKFLGIIALTAVIGFVMTACDEGGGPSTPACTHDWKTEFTDSTATADGSSKDVCSKCSATRLETTYPAWNKFFGTWDNSAAGGNWVREISLEKYYIFMGDGEEYTIENPAYGSCINNNPTFSTAESRLAYPTGLKITGKISGNTSPFFQNGETSTTMLFLSATESNKFADWGMAVGDQIYIKQVK